MPKLPQYGTPQAEVRALPGVQQRSVASPSLFSSGAEDQMRMGGQIMKAGDELGKVAAEMQDRQNLDAVFSRTAAIGNDYLEFKKTVEGRRLSDAKGVTKDADGWWAETTSKHADSLENDAQRRAFMQQSAKMRLQSLDGLASFEAGELRKSVQASGVASVATWTNFAAAQVNTPVEAAAITQAKTMILGSLAALAKADGYAGDNPEAVAIRTKKQEDALTALHMQVIQNKAEKNPEGAKAYYEANKSEIAGNQYDTVDKLLKVGTTKEVAKSFADAIMADNMNEGDALALARKNMKGDELDATILEVKTRFSEQHQQRQRGQSAAADEAYGIFARTGRISDIPTSTLNAMDGKVLLALRKDAQSAVDGQLPKTDWDHYYKLREMASRDPAAFARRDLRQDFPGLGKAEREGLFDLQGRIAKGGDEAKDVATLQTQLSVTHNLLGWRAGDAEKKGTLDTAVQREIDQAQKASGKKLNFAERQKIIDRMVIEGDTNGMWPMGGSRYYEVQGTPAERNFVPTIPKNERAKIVEAIKGDGKPVTDGEVMRRYKLRMGLQ